MRLLLTAVFFCTAVVLNAQQPARHSHNDYEQANPFFTAYQYQFESIEADIFLKDGELFVAHNPQDIKANRTISKLYLQPVADAMTANKGTIYSNPAIKLQLLIDIKTDAYATLNAFITLLNSYPSIITNKSIIITISGNRPKEEDYTNYPDYIFFDGRPGIIYTEASLKKVALISTGFSSCSKWDGKSFLSNDDRNNISKVIAEAKQLHKPFRFWGCPDTELAWKEFIKLGVDYINTDRIELLSAFCKAYNNE